MKNEPASGVREIQEAEADLEAAQEKLNLQALPIRWLVIVALPTCCQWIAVTPTCIHITSNAP